MIEEESLIGQTLEDAKKILKSQKIENIHIIDNLVSDSRCDTRIVCRAKIKDDVATLIVGEFKLEND